MPKVPPHRFPGGSLRPSPYPEAPPRQPAQPVKGAGKDYPLREERDGDFVHYCPAYVPPPRFRKPAPGGHGFGGPAFGRPGFGHGGFPPPPLGYHSGYLPLRAVNPTAAYPEPPIHPPAYLPAPIPAPQGYPPTPMAGPVPAPSLTAHDFALPPPADHPGAGLLRGQPAPWPPQDPGTQGLLDLKTVETYAGAQSVWNGYKLMPPEVKNAVDQFDSATPINIRGFVNGNPMETAEVFHRAGPGPLIPGPMKFGGKDTVALPPDIHLPSARVFLHQHPFTGTHAHETPSMADQLIARQHPGVHHAVQAPAPDALSPNPYVGYSGAFPPRHYTLIENPLNLPVPPPSPDGAVPFHPHPYLAAPPMAGPVP